MACIELLSKDAQKRSRRGEAQPGAVIHHRFEELHPEGQKLIHGWAERAVAQSDCAERDSFEPFIFGWIALNGWACCVTAEDRLLAEGSLRNGLQRCACCLPILRVPILSQ